MKEKLNRKKQKNKGSYTVEATITFTFILLVIFAFIFGIMVLQQQVMLQKMVNSAAMWAVEEENYAAEEGELKNAIRTEMSNEAKRSIFGMDNKDLDSIDVRKNNNLIASDMVEVSVSQEIDVPFGLIVQFFSGNDKLVISASAKAYNCCRIEYIRNFDLGVELIKRLEDKVFN